MPIKYNSLAFKKDKYRVIVLIIFVVNKMICYNFIYLKNQLNLGNKYSTYFGYHNNLGEKLKNRCYINLLMFSGMTVLKFYLHCSDFKFMYNISCP